MSKQRLFPPKNEDTNYYFPGEYLGSLPEFNGEDIVSKLDFGLLVMGSCPFQTECDTANDIVGDPLSNFTTDCNLVEIAGLPRNVDAYRYQDKGVDYFGPSFRFTLSAYIDSESDNRGVCYIWAVSNTLDDGASWTSDKAEALGLFFIKVDDTYQLRLRNHEPYVSDILEVDADVEYRITITREYGVLRADVYSDGSPVGLLEVSVPDDRTYRYLYRVNSYNSTLYQTAEFIGCVNCLDEHLVCFGAGGVAFGGAADVLCGNYAYEAEGGIAFGGAADVFVKHVSVEGSGGIALGGAADAAIKHEGAGGIAFGGVADVTILYRADLPEGGFALGGNADTGMSDIHVEAEGGIAFGGNAKHAIVYEAEGGIAFGGTADTNFDIQLELTSEWNLASTFDIEQDFLWDVESNVRYWFRIESECLPPECDWTDTDWNDPRCFGEGHIQGEPIKYGTKYIQIFPARSVRNLCELISEPINPFWVPSFRWRIKSITRYNLTMRKSDLLDGEIPDCITLTEEDFCNIPECMEFCLETPNVPNVSIGAHVGGVDTFLSYEGTGGFALVGGADHRGGTFFFYTGQGGVAFGGSSDAISPAYAYEAEGGVALGGGADVISEHYQYEAEGGIALGGSSIDLSIVSYEAEGGIAFGGGSTSSTDWGILDTVSIGATTELLSLGGNFVFYDTGPTGLTIEDTEVRVPCGCDYLSLQLKMRNNWSETGVFSDFLQRNSTTFPDQIDLLYHAASHTWKKAYHYTGLSPDATTREQWDLLFQWSCTDEINGEELAGDVWKFAAQIRRKNLSTGQDFQSRLIFAVEKDKVCRADNLALAFSVDTETGMVTTSDGDVLDYVVLYDEVGLFRGPNWSKNPYLDITISEVEAEGPWPRLDITPIFPEQP